MGPGNMNQRRTLQPADYERILGKKTALLDIAESDNAELVNVINACQVEIARLRDLLKAHDVSEEEINGQPEPNREQRRAAGQRGPKKAKLEVVKPEQATETDEASSN